MRRVRWSLRTVLCLVAVVAVALAIWRFHFAIISKTYAIDDLVSHPEQAAWLHVQITQDICPGDWDEVGGVGSCHILPEVGVLEISHRGPIHREVAEYVERWRQQGPDELYRRWIEDAFHPPFIGDGHLTRWPPPPKTRH